MPSEDISLFAFLFHSGAIAAGAVVGACIAFGLNWWLQRWQQKKQNSDKVIDLLLQSVEDQSQFYADYWGRDAADGDASVNHTMKQTRFDALLDFAAEKYDIKNINAVKDLLLQLNMLSTGGDFGAKTRKADAEKARKIHAIANQLYVALLKNKI